jgi:polysaccharide biosynthesis/export protein
MLNRSFTVGTLLALGLSLAGCYTDYGVSGPLIGPTYYGPVAHDPDPIAAPGEAYHLLIGDRVTVTVYGEENLSGVRDVTPTGDLDLPLIGNVRAVGRTPPELERIIAERYKQGKFLTDPKLTIEVVQYRPVYVFGEVPKQGAVVYHSGLNALTAITAAGGLTYRGSRDTVLIQHAGETAWTEYPLVSTVTVLPGDIIRVPERYY